MLDLQSRLGPAAVASRFCATAGGTRLGDSRAWIDVCDPNGRGGMDSVNLNCRETRRGMWQRDVSDRERHV